MSSGEISLNINNFNTKKVTTMRSLFANCAFDELDLSN